MSKIQKMVALSLLLLMPMMMYSQSYNSLWDQVEKAYDDDLPQTEQQVLMKIVRKAEREKNYGQLMKAELQAARRQCEVAPDSLTDILEHLRKRHEAAARQPALQAVYSAVLGVIYDKNVNSIDNHDQLAHDYYEQAMARPELLAKVKAPDYSPFLVMEDDSYRFFGDDLLSVIACETGQYDKARDYYVAVGNRRAALMTSLWAFQKETAGQEDMETYATSAHLRQLDSLINVYADLNEVAELAIERYAFMNAHTDATDAQKWNYIEEALDRWGDWPRMNELRNRQNSLSSRHYNAVFYELSIPNRPQTMTLNRLRGISQLTMRVYKVNAQGDIGYTPSNREGYNYIKPLLSTQPVQTVTRTYEGHQPYEFFEDSLQLNGLPAGVYMIETETKPSTQISRHLYFVSDLRVLVLGLPGYQVRYVAVNATTGRPVSGVQIRLTSGYGRNKVSNTLTTNAKGEAFFVYGENKERPNSLYAYSDTDKSCPPSDGGGVYSFRDYRNNYHGTMIYTDRAIYRPGQTVHVAAVLYKNENGHDNTVMADHKVSIQLRDANYQTVEERETITDNFGTCSASFTLPRQGLTGTYTVVVENNSETIRVEEYKRPAFEVEMDDVTENYRDGDTLSVAGTARSYAGVPVQGATVKYKVERRRAYWWLSYSRYWSNAVIGTASDDVELLSGEALTDDDGRFTVNVPMVLPKTKYTMFYNFVVTAEVTDQAGETHEGELSLPLGNRKAALTTSLPEKVLAESMPDLTFTLTNAAGNSVPATVRYRIDGGSWYEVQTNVQSTVHSSQSTVHSSQFSALSSQLPTLSSGRHTLEAVCEDDSLSESFVVFSLDDKRPAVETDDWFYLSDTQFPNDGSPVTLQVGSSAADVYIAYAFFARNKIVESGITVVSDALVNRKLTYKDEYDDALLFVCAWVKEGQFYQHRATIKRPQPDMKLRMKWETFRDRLTPGQQEEWTLSVMKPDGTPADAQLMATLYDKSLDQLYPNEWSMTPYKSMSIPVTSWLCNGYDKASCQGFFQEHSLDVDYLSFSWFNHDIYPTDIFSNRPRVLYKAMRSRANARPELMYEMAPDEDEMALTSAVADSEDVLEEVALAAGDMADVADEEEAVEQPVQMRENLNETAFFYPQMATDAEGRVVLKFTLPESLTTWRFMGLAHTTNMMTGLLDGEAVAQKDVMIQPNMPRFIRQGDEATISARIINTSGSNLSGTARLQLLDPETEEVVYSTEQEVLLIANSTFAVTFPIACHHEHQSLLIAKVMVSGTTFSDGEQHYLPVLSNMERVTVSVPFTQVEPGTKKIDLSQMIPQTSHLSPLTSHLSPLTSQLTVEYTNNPAWLMVQALAAVGHPHDGCAICQATSLYANAIGAHILAQNPTAKHVFEQWKREDTPQTSLNSQLEKNEELKELLLNETPWVLDAKLESDQRQQLADFFDENLITQRISTAVDKLGKLQGSDGAWSWWPGMPGSFYMTVEVSELLVRLQSMLADTTPLPGTLSPIPNTLKNAFQFMGKEIVEMVEEMKKQEKKGHSQTFPSYKALQWLYICKLDGRELPAKVRDANDYLIRLLKKETKRQTIYEKAVSAIILDNITYVKSLKEFTVYKEDMGRYYDTPRASYSWRDYRIPTQVAAIEAIKRLTPEDTQTIEEMQRWLLQEKRTQSWDTPVNSADAIYAFLNGNSQVLAPQEKTVLKIDGQPIETSDATAAIGYVKTAMPATGAKAFTAEKTSTGTSWGAVYAQFMQSTADIKDQQSGLSVKREILLGSDLSPLTSQLSTVKVGDRVTVRLTIIADRDYDFVQVIDKRAACLEPVNQLSGYDWQGGYYCTPRDATTNYYFDVFRKGRHVIETEYYVDRTGTYETGTCIVECAYSPEFRGLTHSQVIHVKE